MQKIAKVKKIQKQNGGRKPLPINWDEVNKFLMAGSSGVQVAAYIGVSHDTLYDRCKKEKGVGFTEYALEQRQKGNSMLLGKQYQVAMGGNTTMLIWLGKQRLAQREPEVYVKPPENQAAFNQWAKAQKES